MEKVINIRGTLTNMLVGDEIVLDNVKGSTIRNSASQLKEDYGSVYTVNKVSPRTFKVRRNA